MDRLDFSCIGGDCPGLDKGPRSMEHDRRFFNRAGMVIPLYNNDLSMKSDDKQRKHKNQGAIS